jgi:hypothetical protein
MRFTARDDPKKQKGGRKARRFVETFSPALGARAE